MRLWDLIFLVLIFMLYLIVLGDKLIPSQNSKVHNFQGVTNVIRPSTR